MQIKKSNHFLIYLSIILIAAYVGFSRLEYLQFEDMGIFLSIFGFISKGSLMYSEIMEIKDPLFLLSGGYLLKLFGPEAPYLLDIILFIFCGIFSYKLGQKLNFSKLNSYLASIAFFLIHNFYLTAPFANGFAFISATFISATINPATIASL